MEPRSSRAWRWVLLVSLSLNLMAVGGVTAWVLLRPPPNMLGGPMAWHRILLGPQQGEHPWEARLGADWQQHRAVFREATEHSRQGYRDIRRLMLAPTVDRQALAQQLDLSRDAALRLQDSQRALLLGLAQELSAAERQALFHPPHRPERKTCP
ncbi:MAG: periplasmic heavy metal sensor [Magnetococcus sp. WYHC-3]